MNSVSLARSDLQRAEGDPRAAAAAAASISSLASSLYGELAKRPGNVVFSPYSIAVALAMTLNGAVGKTEAEMRAVLAVDDVASYNAGLNALTQAIEGPAGVVTLDAANSLWGQAGIQWEQPFLDTLAREYGTGMSQVDFESAVEAARVLINSWTAEQTHDKIPELIPAGVLDSLTRLVLVNAIYLKAPWLGPFSPTFTKPAPFQLSDGSRVDVPMMGGASIQFGWHQAVGWEAVRLEYEGRAFAMTVVVPEPGTDLSKPDLSELLSWKPDEYVALRLPTWKFRQQASLNETLSALGMPTAFSQADADFRGMTKADAVHVGAVLHEAFVAVDEEGTEAAAATAVGMQARGRPSQPKRVTVDRPFLFVIHDMPRYTPLFVGRVDDPRG